MTREEIKINWLILLVRKWEQWKKSGYFEKASSKLNNYYIDELYFSHMTLLINKNKK